MIETDTRSDIMYFHESKTVELKEKYTPDLNRNCGICHTKALSVAEEKYLPLLKLFERKKKLLVMT